MTAAALWLKLKRELDHIEDLEARFDRHGDDRAASVATICLQDARAALRRAWEESPIES